MAYSIFNDLCLTKRNLILDSAMVTDMRARNNGSCNGLQNTPTIALDEIIPQFISEGVKVDVEVVLLVVMRKPMLGCFLLCEINDLHHETVCFCQRSEVSQEDFILFTRALAVGVLEHEQDERRRLGTITVRTPRSPIHEHISQLRNNWRYSRKRGGRCCVMGVKAQVVCEIADMILRANGQGVKTSVESVNVSGKQEVLGERG
ncbi:hypothetical protein BDP27DRAFT_1312053 [Rhodocollybia butyracea]|uniref:Uncharacterized protein n=1 Tax=Rhodocollybia butyracea TaxID=206335 RepID=A0A9P5QB74_9AGAR|nr:hypothetical protein BDP27DRAFT_1312053 [Rhodocollybia butyracea]